MPGHHPAGPTPPETPNIVQLHPRLRGTAAGATHPAGTPDAPSQTPEAILAETVQALFRYHGQSLTDPDTATAYRVTLEAVLTMVDGALVQGHMDHEAHSRLRSMVLAAQYVPDLL